MSDDWRLRIDLHEADHAHTLTERLKAGELEHALGGAFHDRVAVSIDGAEVFCYTGTRRQAEEAERLIRSLAGEHGWHVDAELARWHPVAEEWEGPDEPVPESDEERAAERAELMDRENREAAERGETEFEVRVQCSSHREAAQFVETLREQGLPTVQRWRYVLVPAADEDSASALAERLRLQAPDASTVTVEGTLRTAFAGLPSNPFAILGGMGG
ncbi:MAG: hypothetical protein ACR2IP_11155 [Solirubrobacteraceae bacterium]